MHCHNAYIPILGQRCRPREQGSKENTWRELIFQQKKVLTLIEGWKGQKWSKMHWIFFMNNSMKSQAQCTKQGWVLCKLNLLTSCHICHFFIPNFPQKMLCSKPSIFFLFLATLCIVVAILWDVYIFRNKSWWANKKNPHEVD